MNYTKPQDVTSPQDLVSNIRVIFDGGDNSISIAKIEWEGDDCFAARWNVARREWDNPEKQQGKTCVGMPTSHGYPVWFILPEELLNRNSEAWKAIEKTQQNET